jgi:DNA modification methylase
MVLTCDRIVSSNDLERSMNVNVFYHGDCLFVMNHDILPESVDLIYLDPPFFTGKVQKGLAKWQPGAMEISYEDSRKFWSEKSHIMRQKAPEWLIHISLTRADFASYLYYMMIRLQACKSVLSPKGTIYLHCDYRASHYLKMIMDEPDLFGVNNFRNEIVWCYSGGGIPKKDFARKHYCILRYSKTDDYVFNVEDIREEYSQEILSRPKSSYAEHSYKNNPGKMTKGWDLNPKGKHPDDWFYMPILDPEAKERIGFPTQKPEALLKRFILASSNKGSIVLDPFCGCGTTIIAAHNLDRRWIGIDIDKSAYDATKGREKQLPLGIKDEFTKASYITRDLEEVLTLNPNDFEKWVNEFYKATKPMPDKGVDGIMQDGTPIQTKSFLIKYPTLSEFITNTKLHPAVPKPLKRVIVVSQVGFHESATKRQFEIETIDTIKVDLITPQEMLKVEYPNPSPAELMR